MKCILVIILLLFHGFTSTAQENEVGEKEFHYNNQIKFSPIRFIDPINGGVEIGMERQYAKIWSSQFSLTYLLPHATEYEKYEGLRLAFEQKFFFASGNMDRFYMAAEFLHSKTRHAREVQMVGIELFERYKDNQPYDTRFDVSKITNIFHLKLGGQFYYKRFLFDVAAGIGVKNKQIEFHEEPLRLDGYRMDELLIERMILNASHFAEGYFIAFPFNIKFGYRF